MVKLINPSEKLEYVVDVFFDKKNKRVNITGFNSECIMQTDFKIKNGKYKIIKDDYQPITKEDFKCLLEMNKTKTGCWGTINDKLLDGGATAIILDLDLKRSHRNYVEEYKKYIYTTASRI